MIASASGGAGFGGLLGYLLSSVKDAEIIGGNVWGEKASAIAREFRATAKKNLRVKKPVRHISISFAEEDGEVDAVIKEEIAREVMIEMGYLLRDGEVPSGKKSDAQYLVVSHGRYDPDHDRTHKHDHMHIAANAVNMAGGWVSNSFDYRKLEIVMRRLEKKHGLRQLTCSWEKDQIAPTHGQHQRFKKEQEQVTAGEIEVAVPPVSQQLQDLVLNNTRDQPSMSELIDRLTSAGVNIRAGVVEVNQRDRTTGQVNTTKKIGLSYEFQGVSFQSADLKASVNQLVLRQRIKFDPVKDFVKLSALESSDLSLSNKKQLQRAIDLAVIGKPTATVFAQRLQQMGVQPRFRITNNRQANVAGDLRVSGVSFEINGKRWNGSQLINGSWPKLLARRGISYSEQRDAETLYEVSQGVDSSVDLERIQLLTKTTNFSTSGVIVVNSPEDSQVPIETLLESDIKKRQPKDISKLSLQIVENPKNAIDTVRGVILDESWDMPNLATFFARLENRGVSISAKIKGIAAISPLGDNFEERKISFVFGFEGIEFDEEQIIDINALVKNGRLTNQEGLDFQAIAQLTYPTQDNQEKLQLILDLAASGKPSVQDFTRRLQLLGVRPHFEFDRSALRLGEMDRAVTGISYRLGDYKFTGGQLIDGSWPRLIDRRGIQFNPDQDLSILRQVNHGYDLSGSVPMIVLSSAQEEYLQDAANHTIKLLKGRSSLESSRVLVSYDGEILLVNRKRPEKTILTAVLDEDSGQWVAIGPTDINQSDVQLLERQADGRRKKQIPPKPQIEELEIELPLEDRSFSVQLEQGELFRSMDYGVKREIDRSL